MSCRIGTGPAAILLATGLAMISAACVHPRNFRAPNERMTPHTAYAEHARARVDVDLLGVDVQRLALNAGVTVAAVRSRLDFSLNLAHGAAGVASVQSKFTMVDTRWYGLGGRVGLTYLTPRTMWFLPKDLRLELGTFNMLSVPIELWSSFPIAYWFAFHLGLGYQRGALWGDFRGDEFLLTSDIVARSFYVEPNVQFFIAGRLALTFGARVAAWSQTVSAIDVELDITPDLRAGVRSVEWIDRALGDHTRFDIGAETRFGRNTHVRLAVNIGAFKPIVLLLVTPSLNFYWRFK